MRSWVRGFLVLSLLFICLQGSSFVPRATAADAAERIHSSDQPAHGTRMLRFEEVWRAGHDDDDVFFGNINDVLEGPDGRIYLLDGQLCRVFVYSSDGELLGEWSREGEGPGELHQPRDLFLLDDGRLGVVNRYQGQFTCLDAEGLAAQDILLRGENGETHASGIVWAAEAWGDVLVMNGYERRVHDDEQQQFLYLDVCDLDGLRLTRLAEKKKVDFDFGNRSYNEKASYFCRWALGPDGLVYMAPERNRYLVEVRRPDGELVREITRDFTPRLRSKEDRERIADGASMWINNERVRMDCTIDEHDPCIGGLRVDEQGRLWVLSSHGRRDLPEGVLRSYDLFDVDGRFADRVNVLPPELSESDGFYLLEGEMAILLRGQGRARGGSEEQDELEEPVPLQVIYLRAAE